MGTTTDSNDDCLTMDGPVWRRVETWVSSKIYPERLRDIDVEQIVNDTLVQLSKVAEANEKQAALDAITPLLRRIAICRLHDAFRACARAIPDTTSRKLGNLKKRRSKYRRGFRLD